jgi:hypothetical protein
MTLGTHLQILTIKKTLNETKRNALILAKKGSERQEMSRDWHENFAFCEAIHTRWLCSGVFGRIRKNELTRVGVYCNGSHSQRLTVATENLVASVHMCPPKQKQIMLNM